MAISSRRRLLTALLASALAGSGLVAATASAAAPATELDERLVRITLANETVASMTVRQAEVVEFLCATYTLVPSGCELDAIDIDAEIAELLA